MVLVIVIAVVTLSIVGYKFHQWLEQRDQPNYRAVYFDDRWSHSPWTTKAAALELARTRRNDAGHKIGRGIQHANQASSGNFYRIDPS